MTFKRRVLSALDRLLEIGLELDVTTRMGVEEQRDALAKSKRAKLDALVEDAQAHVVHTRRRRNGGFVLPQRRGAA